MLYLKNLETNEEITLGFKDAATAERLDQIFERYAARANEIKLEAWQRRGWKHRLKDNFYYVFNEVL